jgi:hypothetical protein
MADDLPPLPPGYFLDPDEARRATEQQRPTTTPLTPADIAPPLGAPPLPAGYSLTPPPPPTAPEPTWRGSVLPVSGDATGSHIDWSSGLPGQIGRAIMAPGQIVTGELPTPYGGRRGGGEVSETQERAMDIASTFGPTSVATRAGAVLPGMAWKYNPPPAPQLKAAANAGYDAARASGLELSGPSVVSMSERLQQRLTADRGIIAETAPQTYAILNKLTDQPEGGFMTVGSLMAAREGLNRIARSPASTETTAAQNAVRHIDDYMMTLNKDDLARTAMGPATPPDPQDVARTLREAHSNYTAAQRSNDLTGSLDRAVTGIENRALMRAEASGTGQNIDNAIRQRILTFISNEENVKGLTPAQLNALKGVVEGTWTQNRLRDIGTIAGKLEFGGGLAGGAITGDPWLTAIGAIAPSITERLARAGEGRLAMRGLESVDQSARMNSPLYRQGIGPQGNGLLSTLPQTGADNAIWRMILPGLLSHPELLQRPQTTPRPLTERELAGRA